MTLRSNDPLRQQSLVAGWAAAIPAKDRIIPVGTHRKVIQAIHENWFNGKAFALREVSSASGVSNSSVVRTLKVLKGIKLLTYLARCYGGRHYKVAIGWSFDLEEVIHAFELARILKI